MQEIFLKFHGELFHAETTKKPQIFSHNFIMQKQWKTTCFLCLKIVFVQTE